ncbi:MAG: DUF5939 domain-containing protein [Myxococcota bacterium]
MSLVFERTFNVPVSPDATWSLLTDPSRFVQSIGDQPPLRFGAPSSTGPVARFPAVAQMGPGVEMPLEYEPLEWIPGRLFASVNHFRGAPMTRASMRIEIASAPDAGSRVTLRMTLDPAEGARQSDLESMAQGQIHGIQRAMERLTARLAAGQEAFPPERPQGADDVVSRARRLAEGLTSNAAEAASRDALIEHLALAPDVEAARVRPLAFAREHSLDPHATLAVCLRASRAGLLELRFDVLCPSCRGVGMRHPRLDQVHEAQHCPACAAGFSLELDRLVEVSFTPPPGLRTTADTVYCIPGPAGAPHLVAQVALVPGEKVPLELHLGEGNYQLRMLRTRTSAHVRVQQGGASDVEVTLDEKGASPAHLTLAPGPVRLTVTSRAAERRLVCLEREGFVPDVATAAQVTAMQEFRDLYPRAAVAAGEQIRVRKLAFLFSDLKGSTAFYERFGDGPAYSDVRRHFDLLRECIAARGGGVVKTIGDAVMGAFDDPASAVAAALEIQRRMPELNRDRAGRDPLQVKIGVHAGPCVAVNANDWLDYFGTTVNMAARIQAQADAGEVVLTAALLDDPDVARAAASIPCTRYQAPLAGLSGTHQLCRLRP